MNYLEQLGMGDICNNEEFFLYMMKDICENGEVLHGYYGCYIWTRWFDILELNCHIEPDGDNNQLTGFTSHVCSDCIWQLAVADTQYELSSDEEDDGKTYILEREYDFVDPASDKESVSVHISLVNADVIPDYHSGDLITMQVSAIASRVSYYPDEKAFTSNPITKIMGKPVLYPMNRVVNFLGGSIVTGKIKSVENFTFLNMAKEEIPIYYIDVETQYGKLSIVHPASLVQEGQQEYIRTGAVISAFCDIQGNVAIGAYQQGAIIDEEHLVALLHSCYIERDFTRLSRQMAEDCQYDYHNEKIYAEGREEVLAFLAGVISNQEKRHIPCYAWIGEVTEYELTPGGTLADDIPPIGTHCVLLAQNEEQRPDCALFLTLDEEGKIKKITSAGWKYAPCRIQLISPGHGGYEVHDAYEEYECIPHTHHTESEWLGMLASAYEKGNFQEMVLYYGFTAECRLEQEPANDIITHRVKNRESMYDHLMQNLTALPGRSVQVIDGVPWGHKGALQIKSPKAELISYVDLNEEGYIQTLHEIWRWQ